MPDRLSQLFTVVETHLGFDIHESGSVLYSGLHTLNPGRFYYLGLNPGGEPTDNPAESIKTHIEQSRTEHNAFLDEEWSPGSRIYEAGAAPQQLHVQTLARLLGVPLRDMFASELIFVRSRATGGVDYANLAKKCWPVHQWMLNIVKPAIVVTNGNSEGKSAYSYVRNAFREDGLFLNELTPAESGHRRYWLKATRVSGHPSVKLILGIPHLSYYHLSTERNRSIVESWLKTTVNELYL